MKDYYQTKTITKEDVDRLLNDYYEERGWDPARGVPEPQRLRQLGLGEYADTMDRAEKHRLV